MKTVFFSILTVLSLQLSYGQKAIEVEKSGKGTTIVFLPGFTTPGSVWSETIANLDGKYETHIVSYAGFNGITPIDTPWYASIKTQLIEYIRKEKLDKFFIVGHSMGGNLATELGAEFDKNLSGLILVDALPCMRELMMPGVPVSSIQYNSPYNNQVINMKDEAFSQMAYGMASNMTNNKDKIEEIASWSLQADRETYVYGYTDLLKLDLRPILQEIDTKTLILGATFPTREMTLKTFEQQYANLKNKNIELVDDSRHFIMFDQPDWFYSQINAYLADHAQ